MALSRVSILICTLMVFTSAQPLCDPSTQYEYNGECCQMCRPGTSMMSTSTCQDPVCKECDDNEYMDTYTTEAKCVRQPYCDPNKNFQWAEHTSKKERTPCLCKKGFHCSSESCITCVGHTVCKAGYGAIIKGNHTHDTVCKKCPDGTFSAEVSWDGVCQKRTECSSGYELRDGSDVSDNICVEKPHWHIGLICAASAVGVAVVALILYCLCKNKTGYAKQKVKSCVEAQYKDTTELQKEEKMPIATPTEDNTESLLLRLPSQEESHSTSPEEDDETGLTENGNILSQDSKEYIVSQAETNETILSL